MKKFLVLFFLIFFTCEAWAWTYTKELREKDCQTFQKPIRVTKPGNLTVALCNVEANFLSAKYGDIKSQVLNLNTSTETTFNWGYICVSTYNLLSSLSDTEINKLFFLLGSYESNWLSSFHIGMLLKEILLLDKKPLNVNSFFFLTLEVPKMIWKEKEHTEKYWTTDKSRFFTALFKGDLDTAKKIIDKQDLSIEKTLCLD